MLLPAVKQSGSVARGAPMAHDEGKSLGQEGGGGRMEWERGLGGGKTGHSEIEEAGLDGLLEAFLRFLWAQS